MVPKTFCQLKTIAFKYAPTFWYIMFLRLILYSFCSCPQFTISIYSRSPTFFRQEIAFTDYSLYGVGAWYFGVGHNFLAFFFFLRIKLGNIDFFKGEILWVQTDISDSGLEYGALLNFVITYPSFFLTLKFGCYFIVIITYLLCYFKYVYIFSSSVHL